MGDFSLFIFELKMCVVDLAKTKLNLKREKLNLYFKKKILPLVKCSFRKSFLSKVL
jgi:hypothetical protein